MSQKDFSQDAVIEKSKELIRQSMPIWNEVIGKTLKTEVQSAKGEILEEIDNRDQDKKDLASILIEEFFKEFESEITPKMARKLGRIENVVGGL